MPGPKTLTASEQALADFYADPARREAKARAALEAAIEREQAAAAPPVDTRTPAEQALAAFLTDPARREAKARKALADAIAREEAEAAPKTDKLTESERALKQFNDDPERREARAKKSLDAARRREDQERLESSPGYKTANRVGQAAQDTVTGVMNQVVAKFQSVIGPAAILGQVLSASTSGFQVLTKATQLLAAVIAPVLLPATLLLSTALIAISDTLEKGLEGSAEPFFDLLLGLGIPAIVGFVTALEQVIDFVRRNAASAEEVGESVEGFFEASGLNDLRDFLNRHLLGEEAVGDGAVATGAAGGRTETTDIEATVLGALRDSLTSLRQSIGPKAQISQLGQIGQAAQLAALNTDPIEARILKIQEKTFALIEKAVNKYVAGRRPGAAFVDPADATGIRADRGAGGGLEGGGDF